MPAESPGISAREAIEALEAVREVERRTRQAISSSGGGRIVTVWGVVWAVGFLCSHFLQGYSLGWLWLALNLAGAIATGWIVARTSRRARDPVGPRIAGLWLAIVAYGIVWLMLSSPLTGMQVGALLSSIAMFGYVVMGLWLDRAFLWIGLSVTAAIVVGFFALPQIFGLWMAIFGGGALIAAGLRIQRRWR